MYLHSAFARPPSAGGSSLSGNDYTGRVTRSDESEATRIASAVIDWFVAEARELPWRGETAGDIDAWAVLVSEFMLQQTQASRVAPLFEAWMARWPRPSDLAAEAPGEAVRAWGRLGYPRRALWLHRAAVQIATEHGDQVPQDVETLLALTGIGPYTARAVASFAFAARHPVVDTNTRRVLARAVHGIAAAGPPRPSDLDDMERLLPESPTRARQFNAAMMELGAVVCTARAPRCNDCPIAAWCQWRGAGFPDNAPTVKRQGAFNGSDRQVRGRIMALLRHSEEPVARDEALAAAADGGVRDREQPRRAYDSLISDGLLVEHGETVRLP